jgi:hypothetical protein
MIAFDPLRSLASELQVRMSAFIKSPWFPGLAALIFAALGLIWEGERYYLLGLAGAAAFWAAIDVASRIFGTGGGEA